MKLQKLKTIYVDVDGTICKTKNRPDFDDVPMDYEGVIPYPDRIKAIN